MTIDSLGTFAAARPERGYPAQGTLPNSSRTPVAAATAAAATATGTTAAAGTEPAMPAGTSPDSGGPTDELKDAVSKLNASVPAQSLEFSIDEDSKRTVVKVIDTATKEVVRQMPTEEALEISKALDKAFGLLIRQQA
jgi:flagellar protein FlaG